MASIADLRPGMLGFGKIDGAARWPVWAGQMLLGEGFTVGPLKIEHVFVVTSSQEERRALAQGVREAAGYGGKSYGDGPLAVEAMPNGARQVSIADRWTPEYAYVQLPEDYPGQGEDAAAIARAMIGTPYSFASYVALAAWHLGLKTKRLEAWIDRRKPLAWPISGLSDHCAASIRLPREAICSVLADQAWALTGKQVMPPGTPHQCVTPGALGAALLEMDGARWLWPGR